MGAQDSESTSLTDEDVCHELEGATSSQESSAISGTKGIDFSRTSLESSASLEGLSSLVLLHLYVVSLPFILVLILQKIYMAPKSKQ